jgi:large subunit ribosomal protein L25
MSTTLKAEVRAKVGTRSARALRAQGRIPGNLQGGAVAPHIDLSIDEDEFLTARRHHQHLYELQIGGKVETALIEDLQWDVFGERIQHVEFRRVDRFAKTDVVVPIEFLGEPKSGVVMHLRNELTILTTPDAIPDSLIVKVGELVIGDTIKASQVPLPAGATLYEDEDPQAVVAHVIEPKVEALPTAPVAEAAAAAATAAPAAEAGAAAKPGAKPEGGAG